MTIARHRRNVQTARRRLAAPMLAAPLMAAPLLSGIILVAAPAAARVRVSPYIEAQQVLDVPISGGGDVLTYTALAAGVDASATGQRIQGSLSYRYEHRFSWSHRLADSDVHSGLARGSAVLVPNLLTLQAGAIATRARADIRGAAPGFLTDDGRNVTQVYSGYVGPSLATRVGPLDVAASYRFGYTKVDDGFDRGILPSGQPARSLFDSSTEHSVAASIGMAPGPLPVGLSLSGGYDREQAKPLSQRFENAFVRGQVTVPVSATLAVTGAVGYEDLRASQRAVLVNAAGVPVVDRKGRLVSDRTKPRQIAYDFDGLLYDVGVIWRPDTRTTLIATVGRRYGHLAVNGSFNHRINSASAVSVNVYNSVDSFGRSLNRGLSGLPTQFAVPRMGFANSYTGCVFGSEGNGGCLNDAFQSLNGGQYRARGVNALYSARRGPVSLGFGVSYDERKYLAPRAQPGVVFYNGTDRSVVAQGTAGFAIDERSSLQNQVFVGYYRSGDGDGVRGSTEVLSGGIGTTYLRSFTDRLSGNAGVTLYASDQDDAETQLVGQVLLGARYQF